MKRFFSTRHGFFALAALICWSTLVVIQAEHRWVALASGGLYAMLSVLYLLEDVGRQRRR